MARRGTITHFFGDGEHEFRLRIGELIELQEKCDAGPPHVLLRLSSNSWRVNDIRETIRLGLIGGGKTATEAGVLVKRYVDGPNDEPVPLAPLALSAELILAAALYGVEDEPIPKETPSTDEQPGVNAENSHGGSGT